MIDPPRETPISFLNYFLSIAKNPTWLIAIGFMYFITIGFSLFYFWQEKQTAELKHSLDRATTLLDSAQRDRDTVVARSFDNSGTIDIFRRLSFESDDSEKRLDNPKLLDALEAARRLNALARYALDRHDPEKASMVLEDSLQAYPTSEALYYSGVVAYLHGDNEKAIADWRRLVEGSKNPPQDLSLYISIAEYRLGAIEEAKRFAGHFSNSLQ